VWRSRDGYVSLGAVTMVTTDFRLANAGAPCRVPTVATVDVLLATAANADVGIGPYPAGAPDTEEVRARHVLPIGASLAAFTVGWRPTPVEFWRTVGAHIRADPGRVAACAPVLNWARMALLAPLAPATQRPIQSGPCPLVDLSNDMLEGRLDLAKRDLPGLRPGADDPMTMVASSVNALVGLTARTSHEAAVRRAEDRAPKTPSTLLKGALEAILRLCEVDHEAALPAVYGRIANADKGDRLAVAQRDLNRVVAADITYRGAAPSLTSELLRRLLEPRWGGVDIEDVNDSITPFHTSFSSTQNQAARVRLQDRYALLASGQVVTLSEILQLEEMEKLNVAMPVTWTQLKFTLIGYYFLCVQWLGPTHRVARGVSASIAAAQNYELFLTETIERRPQLPVLILRRWQQRLFQFYTAHASQATYATLPFPDLTTMWFEILEGSWSEPPLPPAFLPRAPDIGWPRPVLPPGGPPIGPPSGPPAGPPPGGPNPVPSGPTPTPPGRGAGELRMKASGPVPRVVELAGTGWRSKDVRERFADRWPTNSQGKPMCLPWHHRGSCYTLCGRRADHIDHSPEEEETLCSFLTENFSEFRSN